MPLAKPSVYTQFALRLLEHLKYNPDTTILYHGTSPNDRNWGDQLNAYLLPLLSGKNNAMIPLLYQKRKSWRCLSYYNEIVSPIT